MDFNLIKDIDRAKTVLEMNEKGIAAFLGVSTMTLSRWRRNLVNPSHETLEKVYGCIYDAGVNLNRIKEELDGSKTKEGHVLLFHGAKGELKGKPSVTFGDTNKDFGRAFYLGESFDQSASFIVNYDSSSVYAFDFNPEGMLTKEFSVSREWAILIAYFRGKLKDYEDSPYLKSLVSSLEEVDVVIAPIADNTMYTILDEFVAGKITDLQCLSALSANRLGRQFAFLNDEAIRKGLRFQERLFFCQSERRDYRAYREKEDAIGKDRVKLALREYAGKGVYIEGLLA